MPQQQRDLGGRLLTPADPLLFSFFSFLFLIPFFAPLLLSACWRELALRGTYRVLIRYASTGRLRHRRLRLSPYSAADR